MIQFDEASIQRIIFHRVNAEDKMPTLSNSLSDFKNDEEEEVLKKVFLKPFQSVSSTGEFSHEINVNLNPLYKLSKAIQQGEDFIEQSKSICNYLKSVSKHPNIKEGELFVLKFENIKMNDRFYEALGVYKIENKEPFIETTFQGKKEAHLNFRKGIGSRKLDKACLIVFNEDPFTLFVIDNAKTETDYWQNEFIKMTLKDDALNNTNEFLAMTKSFVTKELPLEMKMNKADQIDLLNKSVDYFKTHDSFDKREFESEVLQHDEVIDSFRKYNAAHREDDQGNTDYRFEISQQAVKRQSRIFKSVLKLDKNFHIYIHGDRELIEQGVDRDGRKFYKIYYQAES